ncbi:TIGR03621 family F420-dependent LLM class oxidoreductase [Allokutzneria sp. A3M-2-11 16]|uniref:TIGR03621 family F420-dependent LLM class oxidoreductase n=1 Tax=Allokutzneria sp. A3M-2-11 16 TaxID=2962043 RepID=UPI0020B8C319|nr:TIGR03621 family F420-dependent LLM class oxidoreductase [Allokutzneria sp. A3M-2-11 16]MCP3803253.1 TIGR03621 family F420-dependent LLM class oxidoreductase [Allokutzneria sp. A3M-2-11 16]
MGDFRFGVVMHAVGGRAEWAEKCREAERLGYDVILVPDHLGFPAPFSAMTAAAQATERPAVGSFVLNTSFWNPTLLAREAATTDQLTGGRLELGLGAGHRKDEFEATGVPWRPLAERIEFLEHTLGELSRLFAEGKPEPVRPSGPPLLLGGNSDRVLKLAAEHADIVGFSALAKASTPQGFRIIDAESMDGRVAYLRSAAGDRFSALELNILVRDVIITDDRDAAVGRWLEQAPYLDADGFLAAPAVLVGTVDEIAEQARQWRKRFGFSYFAVHEPWMATFAPIIAALAGE